MENYKELLDKARRLNIEENKKYNDNGDTCLRESGFVLEDRHQLLYPKLNRLSSRGKKGDWDFAHNEILIDIKGCWANKYGGTIFIERIANIQKNTIPCFLKEQYKNNKKALWYVDFETGTEYIIKLNELLPKLKYERTTLGGYNKNVLGWKINPNDWSDITIKRRD